MKRAKSLIGILLLFLTASAQQFRPMLKDGKQWLCYYTNGFCELNFCYYLKGDTIIDGEKCHKLYASTVNQWTGDTLTYDDLVGAMLEDGGQVYLFSNQHGKELLCDFNLKVGDTALGNGQWTVTDIKNIYAIGAVHRCLTLEQKSQDPTNDNHTETQYWVEGVGSSRGFDLYGYLPLVSCYEDNHCIFTQWNFEDMPEKAIGVEEYHPLVSEGKEWWYKDDMAVWYDRSEDFRLFVRGDTLIDGRTWKKVYSDNTIGSTPVYAKAVREENGRIYERQQNREECLLFDFKMGVGDRYVPTESNDRFMEVIAVDTMLSAGIPHRRLILQQYVNGVATDLTCWVEGVGSDCGIDLSAFWSDMDAKVINERGGTDYYQYRFIGCLEQNGQCLYGDIPSEITTVPTFHQRSYVWSLYDLYGRQFTQKPEKGVYIENGRKRVVK
jgi:hypothetical protein